MTSLDVSEVFGPTVQGEGPSLGRRCCFVRLVRCNLDCGEGPGATWRCDTPYTWRWQGRYDDSRHRVYLPVNESHATTVDAVATDVAQRRVALCVVSGGEPMLQRTAVAALAARLAPDVAVEVETNGTIHPGPALAPVAAFNVSPKLANSGVSQGKRLVLDVLAELADSGKARFKFVASTPADLGEVAALALAVPLAPEQVWIMPSGESASEVARHLKALATPTIEAGWNLTTRLHVELWGNRRGV